MNGIGKSGIHANPDGEGFIAKAKTIVKLIIRTVLSDEQLAVLGKVTFKVRYGNEIIPLEGNSFTLDVQEGKEFLSVEMEGSLPPHLVELVDSDGHVLARLKSESEKFQIKGT